MSSRSSLAWKMIQMILRLQHDDLGPCQPNENATLCVCRGARKPRKKKPVTLQLQRKQPSSFDELASRGTSASPRLPDWQTNLLPQAGRRPLTALPSTGPMLPQPSPGPAQRGSISRPSGSPQGARVSSVPPSIHVSVNKPIL